MRRAVWKHGVWNIETGIDGGTGHFHILVLGMVSGGLGIQPASESNTAKRGLSESKHLEMRWKTAFPQAFFARLHSAGCVSLMCALR